MTIIQKRLHKAGDLSALLGITPREVVCISVYGASLLMIHLKWRALARVSRQLRIPRNKIDVTTSEGSLSVTFTSRGATFTTFVKRTEVAEFLAAVEHAGGKLPSQSRINREACKPRGLPAPVLTGD